MIAQFQRLLRLVSRPFAKSSSKPVLPSKAAYAQWAKHYPAQAHNPLMQVEEHAMQALMPPLQGKIVLDLACGTGRWAQWAMQHGASQVLAFDNSMAMLQHASHKQRVLAEMDQIPLTAAAVDVVLCALALGHLPKTRFQAAMQDIARILRPGGILLLSDFHPFLAWQGAQRSFTGDDGQSYAVEHYLHSISDYFEVAQSLGLQFDAMQEPVYADAAGKPMPLVVVLRLTKTTSAHHNHTHSHNN